MKITSYLGYSHLSVFVCFLDEKFKNFDGGHIFGLLNEKVGEVGVKSGKTIN